MRSCIASYVFKGLLTHRRKRPNVIMRILTNRTKAKFVIVRKCTFYIVGDVRMDASAFVCDRTISAVRRKILSMFKNF